MKCSVSIVGGTLPTAELERDNGVDHIRPSACGRGLFGNQHFMSGVATCSAVIVLKDGGTGAEAGARAKPLSVDSDDLPDGVPIKNRTRLE